MRLKRGHLVMATMHTQRAVMAVHRMISLFPGEQQEEIRSQISQVVTCCYMSNDFLGGIKSLLPFVIFC